MAGVCGALDDDAGLLHAPFSVDVLAVWEHGPSDVYVNYIMLFTLSSCSHPLPKAVLLLCKSVQMSLSPLKGEGAVACLSHCDRASSYLRTSISVPLSAQSGNWLNKVLSQNAGV